MIRALQTYLQKHHKFVFFVLLVVIIIAFVFTIGAAPGIGPDRSRTDRQEFFGFNLASPRDQEEIARRAQVSQRFQQGEPFRDERQFSNYALERIALLGLASKLRLPSPGERELVEFIRGRPAFQDEFGRYSSMKYQRFIDEIEADPQLDMGFVSEVVDEDFRIERARQLVSGPAFLLPTEIRLQMEQARTIYTLALASFDTAEFQPDIEVVEEDLQAFFEENEIRFQRSEQVLFSYATFRNSDFVDKVELDDSRLERYFLENKGRFTPPVPPASEEDPEVPPPAEVTLEDVREQVERAFRQERSRVLAARAAADFAYAVFDGEIRLNDPRMEELLDQFHGTLEEAPPASRDEFPAELAFTAQARQEVFRLGRDRFFSDPVQVGNRFLVLFYRESIPAVTPPLFEIRDRVEAAFKEEERQRLLAGHGLALREFLRDQVAEGRSFVEAAGDKNLEAKSLEPFSLRDDRPEDLSPALLQRLDELQVGEVSGMIPVRQQSYFLFLKEKTIPEIDTEDDEFRMMADNLAMWTGMLAGNAFLQEFIERGAPDLR